MSPLLPHCTTTSYTEAECHRFHKRRDPTPRNSIIFHRKGRPPAPSYRCSQCVRWAGVHRWTPPECTLPVGLTECPGTTGNWGRPGARWSHLHNEDTRVRAVEGARLRQSTGARYLKSSFSESRTTITSFYALS